MNRASLAVPVTELQTHLVEDRRATISAWGRGNSKLGRNVYTFSRLPGRVGGTCPGSTWACEAVCYAKRIVRESPALRELYARNTLAPDLSGLPSDATLVRIHVSGDFDSAEYIQQWTALVRARPAVTFFGYTRSWRVPELRAGLSELRALPNVTLFASVDGDLTRQEGEYLRAAAWRCAIMLPENRLDCLRSDGFVITGAQAIRSYTAAGEPVNSLICPEETGRRADCESCGFCFRATRGNVIFLEH